MGALGRAPLGAGLQWVAGSVVSRRIAAVSLVFSTVGGCAAETPPGHEAGVVDAERADARGRGEVPRGGPPQAIGPTRASRSGSPTARVAEATVRHGQWSVADRLVVGDRIDHAQEIVASPSSAQVSAPDIARDPSAGTFVVRVDEDPAQWSRAFIVFELGALPHWTAARRRINGAPEQGGYRPSRNSNGGTQVEEIAPSALVQGRNTIQWLPKDAQDPVGYRVSSVRLVALRADSSVEPMHAPAESHGAAYARWTDGDTTTAVGLTERSSDDRAARWLWREPARVRAVRLAATGTGTTQLELSWSPDGGRSIARRTIEVSPTTGGPEARQTIAIDPPIETSELRIATNLARENAGLGIGELDVDAARASSVENSRVRVTYPTHGECIESEAYVRGFVTARPGVRTTTLSIDGTVVSSQANADGSFGHLVALPRVGSRSEHVVEAQFSDGTIARERVLLGRCVTPPAAAVAAAREDVGAPFSGWARANRATTLALGDAVLEIPAGAVAADTRITLRPVETGAVARLDQGMTNVMPDGRAYRFGPDGIRFSRPIRLVLPYSASRLPTGTTSADVKTFFYDEGGQRWREVTRVASGADRRIAALTNHFTDYITSTITAPDSPQSTAFDSNTIQGLQAANPAAGVQMIAPPTPTNSGSANIAYPIELPPGRNGMQPSVALSYNSDADNGWVGVGWNVAFSRIEVDTRWGVPDYTPTSRERYLLDGAQLVPLDPMQLETVSPREYRRRDEGSFDRIIRHGTSKTEYHWEVIARDGTRSWYGTTRDSQLCGWTGGPDKWCHEFTPAGSSPIGRWSISQQRDVYGNAIVYNYLRREGRRTTVYTFGPKYSEQYLASIEYTRSYGPGGGAVPTLLGSYEVHFETDFARQDTVSSARMGFDYRQLGRLSRIRVEHVARPDGKPEERTIVRAYNLEYVEGDFGKSLLSKIRVRGLGDASELYAHTMTYRQAQRFGNLFGFAPPSLYSSLTLPNVAPDMNSAQTMNTYVGFGDAAKFIDIGAGGAAVGSGNRTNWQRADVDGDGLPDYVTGANQWFRQAAGTPAFVSMGPDPAHPFDLSATAFSESLTAGVNPGLRIKTLAGGGANFSWNWDRTTQMMTDANGDGLIDFVRGPILVSEGGVTASALAVHENPRPHARLDFGSSGNFDYTIGGVDTTVVETPVVTDATVVNNFAVPTAPLVRWLSQAEGEVKITGAITAPPLPSDGVLVQIYRASSEYRFATSAASVALTPIWQRVIEPGQPPCTPQGSDACGTGIVLSGANRILREERLYFVVRPFPNSLSNSTVADRVEWSPHIEYLSVDPLNRCPGIEGCVEPTPIAVPVGAVFDRTTDFRVADRDIYGWFAVHGGTVTISAAHVTLPPATTAKARIYRRRTTRFSGAPATLAGLPPPTDSGTGDASSDSAAVPPRVNAAQFEALLADTNAVVELLATVDLPAGGGLGPSFTSGLDVIRGDILYFSIEVLNNAVDPGQIKWEPTILFTHWTSNPTGSMPTPVAITGCGTPAGQCEDGSPCCLWPGSEPPGHATRTRIPVAVVEQHAPLLAISVVGSPSHDRRDLTVGWYRGWAAGELNGRNSAFYERWLREPLWDPTTGATPTVQQLFESMQSNGAIQPSFVPMAVTRVTSDPSVESEELRQVYGFDTIPAPGTPPALMYTGTGVESAVTHRHMLASRRGGIFADSSGRVVVDRAFRRQASNATGMRHGRSFTQGGYLSLPGASGTLVVTDSHVTQDFFDLDGDRIPDSVRRGTWQRQRGNRLEATRPVGEPPFDTEYELRHTSTRSLRGSFSLGSLASWMTNGAVSILPSIGVSDSASLTDFDQVDFNGDGLVDRIGVLPSDTSRVVVALNVGGKFLPPSPVPFDTTSPPAGAEGAYPRYATSNNVSAAWGYSGFGGGPSFGWTRELARYIDLNGDRLPDRVTSVAGAPGFFHVRFNLGDRFGPELEWNAQRWETVSGMTWSPDDETLEFSRSVSGNASAGGGVSIPIPFPLIPLAVHIEASAVLEGGFGHGDGRVEFDDINGDGLVDHLLTRQQFGGATQVYARVNRTELANVLERVEGPFGNWFSLEYQRAGNRVETLPSGERIEMPNARWVLSAVHQPSTTSDVPFPGTNPRYTSTFQYQGGYYDRAEREDYGFSVVSSCNALGTCEDTFFHNQSFAMRGRVQRTQVRNSLGNLISSTQTNYQVYTAGLAPGAAHVRTIEQQTFAHDPTAPPTTPPPIGSNTVFEFEPGVSDGRLRAIHSYGEAGTGDDVHVHFTAYYSNVNYNLLRASDVELRDHGGAVLRRRSATFGTLGQLETTTDYLTGGKNPVDGTDYVNVARTTTYVRDGYGNLTSVTDPSGATVSVEYDPDQHQFRQKVTDAFGLFSTTQYDNRTGYVTRITDTNNQQVHFAYDVFGRRTSVWGPQDPPASSSPTVSYEYELQPGVATSVRPWAITHHKDPANSATIDTVTFIDRTLRVVQTKKTGVLDAGHGFPGQLGWVVSGPVQYDSIGRAQRQFRGGFDTTASPTHFVEYSRTLSDPNVRTVYDAFDRVTRVIAPDGTKTNTQYAFLAAPGESTVRLRTRLIDAMGREHDRYARGDGSVVAVVQRNRIGGVWHDLVTRYAYDSLARLVQVRDATATAPTTGGNVTTATYDSFGRMTSLDNPDSGLIEYRFSLAGDLGARIPPNLRAVGKAIRYVYDRHRLMEVQYPNGTTSQLYYGGLGDPYNSAGRITWRIDDAGWTNFEYGSLGETTRVTRWLSPAGSVSNWTYATTSFDYDSFGRMRSVTYPDGEIVNYSYNRAGDLYKVLGARTYLSEVGYDEFGQRHRVRYGNGVESVYVRDPLMQRLSDVETNDSTSFGLQRLHYEYNDVGNITGVHNNLASIVSGTGSATFGGATHQTYAYDDLDQLTGATGIFRSDATHERRYTLSMEYDGIGNITSKVQNDALTAVGGGSPVNVSATSHNLAYNYLTHGSTRPHAASDVGSREFEFDANGNQLGWVDTATGSVRQLAWNAEDRLESVTTDGSTVEFRYDAAGERTHKWSSAGTSIYVNAYWTVRNGAQTTKHIFATGQRIASVVDGGAGDMPMWFHTDHLGSTQYVTDGSGLAREHYESFPFGEPWIEQSADTESVPYRFTGKELDSETGLQYFGARYYDPRQAQWASVDPALPELYRGGGSAAGGIQNSHLAVYSYSWQSPVRLRDPDGRDVEWAVLARNMLFCINPVSCAFFGTMGMLDVNSANAPGPGSALQSRRSTRDEVGDVVVGAAFPLRGQIRRQVFTRAEGEAASAAEGAHALQLPGGTVRGGLSQAEEVALEEVRVARGASTAVGAAAGNNQAFDAILDGVERLDLKFNMDQTAVAGRARALANEISGAYTAARGVTPTPGTTRQITLYARLSQFTAADLMMQIRAFVATAPANNGFRSVCSSLIGTVNVRTSDGWLRISRAAAGGPLVFERLPARAGALATPPRR